MPRWQIPTCVQTIPKAADRCCRSFARRQQGKHLERLLQYLDDLDDLYGAAGLLLERLRTIASLVVILVSSGVLLAGGVLLALREPPLALATAILLFTTLLYRAVTEPGLEIKP